MMTKSLARCRAPGRGGSRRGSGCACAVDLAPERCRAKRLQDRGLALRAARSASAATSAGSVGSRSRSSRNTCARQVAHRLVERALVERRERLGREARIVAVATPARGAARPVRRPSRRADLEVARRPARRPAAAAPARSGRAADACGRGSGLAGLVGAPARARSSARRCRACSARRRPRWRRSPAGRRASPARPARPRYSSAPATGAACAKPAAR